MTEAMQVETSGRKTKPRDRILQAALSEFIDKGFEGARIQSIADQAEANPKVLYSHFRSKSELYIAVIEGALGALRQREKIIDVAREEPIAGLLTLFDFLCDHFRTHPELVRLLTNENIAQAKYLRQSEKISDMSSPVLRQIEGLLSQGQTAGAIRKEIEPLTLYVMMAGLSQFYISNAYTLSAIFETDISTTGWRDRHNASARQMIECYLTPGNSGIAQK